ncbi:Na+/H+ antiporter NhaD and related arsenite permeases NhaD and related arsenite permeases [Magnetospirillum sp. XM-1]|uniref:citrate transporter n=1 Tax=Magnetospirillum sp. XM-1 TaxID=1663591 RepID=UPI00073DCE55|nr:citrate transporter [Magnetospirillum sp. XM-1]CUW40930.1 Na+/H+ antiporter NhaD and related arsenite permeases NhaD and related arsenite permeases [Magnetospirillum sp. XM-1]
MTLFGIPLEFVLFAATLLGVALLHNHTLYVGLAGFGVISLYKIAVTGFKEGAGLAGFAAHLGHEWVTVANLFCLLMGFALLARHFEKSHVPVVLPKYLPDDWKGGFVMLVMVFVISSFLDNIAAALIGGAMAHQLFRAKVHVGFLAAIVAASNAGGSGSVVGDTTTTMLWISGVHPGQVFEAYVAAGVSLLIVGVIGAKQQHAYSPILKSTHAHTHVDWGRVGIVAVMLGAAIMANVAVNLSAPQMADQFPFIGGAVWIAVVATMSVRRPDWEIMPETAKGSVFLLSLVLCASMMPVEQLPPASAFTALQLGFVSAVFDNIPLTALAIKQGGYDWGYLAYAVGFGGSMIWFGSSAGVALSNMYPEAKSVAQWLKQGWHVTLAYVVGFAVMAALVPWRPDGLP